MSVNRDLVALWSRRKKHQPLLMLLHGYGSNEHDIAGLAETLPQDCSVVALRAPFPADFAWFPFTSETLEYAIEHVVEATQLVSEWIRGVKAEHSAIVAVGFSQGMAMATSLARFRPEDLTAVIGLSGFVVLPQAGVRGDLSTGFFRDDVLRAKNMPMFWGRDREDPVIPPSWIEASHGWLRAHMRLTSMLYTGLGHSIAATEKNHMNEFLRSILP